MGYIANGILTKYQWLIYRGYDFNSLPYESRHRGSYMISNIEHIILDIQHTSSFLSIVSRPRLFDVR